MLNNLSNALVESTNTKLRVLQRQGHRLQGARAPDRSRTARPRWLLSAATGSPGRTIDPRMSQESLIFSRATKRFGSEEAAKPLSLADMLSRHDDGQPIAIADALAREGLVEPIPWPKCLPITVPPIRYRLPICWPGTIVRNLQPLPTWSPASEPRNR